MIPKKLNLKNTRGDSMDPFIIEIPNSVDVTAIRFTVKKSDKDTVHLFQKNFDNGVVNETEDGDDHQTFSVYLDPEDTYDLEPGKYVYDLQLVLGSDVGTLIKGSFTILSDTTREVR